MTPIGNWQEVRGFREIWVYIEVGLFSPQLQAPMILAVPNPRWARVELPSGGKMAPMLAWLRLLMNGCLLGPKFAKELLRQQITPL